MVSVTIRHVPDATRDELAARASRKGQSLQEYLLAVVVDAAERPDVAALLAEQRARLASEGSTVTTDSILDVLHAARR